MALIAVVGKAYVGKDTFGKMLAEELNKLQYPPYVLMAYANELKLRCQKDFDLSYEQLWGSEKERNDLRYPKADYGFSSNPADYLTGREIMQMYGQFFRSIDYDFWVKNLFKVIEEKEYTNVIITDVRHINEAEAVKEHKGLLLKITREDKTKPHGETHISETALDNYDRFDFTVINDYGLEELREVTKDVVKFLQSVEAVPKAQPKSDDFLIRSTQKKSLREDF
jgi:hypothetical protein